MYINVLRKRGMSFIEPEGIESKNNKCTVKYATRFANADRKNSKIRIIDEIMIIFMKITKNSLYEWNYENLGKMHRWRCKYKARYTFHNREINLAFLLQSVCIRDGTLAFRYFTR